MSFFQVRNIIVALTFLMLPTAAMGQKVSVNFDKAIDFSKFKTYTWRDGMPAQNPMINQMISEAIDRELTSRGLTKKESAGELQVLFFAAADFDLQVPSGNYGNVAVSSVQTGIATRGQAYDVRKGTLLVNLIEASTNNILWGGSASETLTQRPTGNVFEDAQKVEKLVNRAVQKLFRKYPISQKTH